MIIFSNANRIPKSYIDESFTLGTNDEHRTRIGYHDIANKNNFNKPRKGKSLFGIFIFLILKNL